MDELSGNHNYIILHDLKETNASGHDGGQDGGIYGGGKKSHRNETLAAQPIFPFFFSAADIVGARD